MELESAPIAAFEEYFDPKGEDYLVIVQKASGKTLKIKAQYFGQTAPSTNYKWVSSFDYPVDAIVDFNGQWYLSLQTPNLGKTPSLEPTYWELQSKSPAGFVFWQAGVFTGDPVLVLYEIAPDQIEIYILKDPTRPYLSSDFEAELALGDWEIISEGQTPFKGIYVSEAALNIAHPTANPGDYADVDPGLGTPAVRYIWDEDEGWVAGGSSAGAWSTAVAGVVEQSTQAESEAIATGANTLSTAGLSNDRAPSEIGLYHLIIKFLTLAWTWTLKQTFTAAPRFSSTTASQFLKVDSNKDLVSTAVATQAEMITGTDNDKPATAKSVEDKGSVKLRSVSNSATGTNNIDCQNQDTVHVVFGTVLTGANEITVSNAGNLQVLNVTVQITGANINITTPSSTRMARYHEVASGPGWYQSTKILQVSAIGTADFFELSFKRSLTDASVFTLTYDGPTRA